MPNQQVPPADGLRPAADASRWTRRTNVTGAIDQLRVILVGGSSHAGKSQLAGSLAAHLGWRCVSTDGLARHPGRPWKTKLRAVPDHVAEHYVSLSVDELIADVLRHYRSVWPGIEALVTSHATDASADRLVLEGSALWPESVLTLKVNNVAAIWLTASDRLFRARIREASGFERAEAREKEMIQKFLDRTLRYNAEMMSAVNRHGLVSLDVEGSSDPVQLRERCLELILQNPLEPSSRTRHGNAASGGVP